MEALLESRYGKHPDESSGPVLDQLVWFLLSTRTTVENCDAAYGALRERYPTWAAAAEVRPVKEKAGPGGPASRLAAPFGAQASTVWRRR